MAAIWLRSTTYNSFTGLNTNGGSDWANTTGNEYSRDTSTVTELSDSSLIYFGNDVASSGTAASLTVGTYAYVSGSDLLHVYLPTDDFLEVSEGSDPDSVVDNYVKFFNVGLHKIFDEVDTDYEVDIAQINCMNIDSATDSNVIFQLYRIKTDDILYDITPKLTLVGGDNVYLSGITLNTDEGLYVRCDKPMVFDISANIRSTAE